MTYTRCNIKASTEGKSRYLEIQTDRTSYLMGDVVLVTIASKIDHTPQYEKLFLLVSCVGNITRSMLDIKLPPNTVHLSKTYFEIKNEFTNQKYPLSYSFALPNSAPFTGDECSFISKVPLESQYFRLGLDHSYRFVLITMNVSTINI